MHGVLDMYQSNLLDMRALGTVDCGDEAHFSHHLCVDVAVGLHSIPVWARQRNYVLARRQTKFFFCVAMRTSLQLYWIIFIPITDSLSNSTTGLTYTMNSLVLVKYFRGHTPVYRSCKQLSWRSARVSWYVSHNFVTNCIFVHNSNDLISSTARRQYYFSWVATWWRTWQRSFSFFLNLNQFGIRLYFTEKDAVVHPGGHLKLIDLIPPLCALSRLTLVLHSVSVLLITWSIDPQVSLSTESFIY